MPTQTNLRFLLSLGNQKVVIMQKQDQLQIYTTRQDAAQSNVSPVRLSEAVESR